MAESSPQTHASPRSARRVRRHLLIALGALALSGTGAWLLPGALRERISLATAYVALGLLGTTLLLGPLNVLRGRPNPVSFNLRRDFGIWTAVLGIAHTGVGLTVHFTGRMWLYFLPPPDGRSLLGLRADLFGATNLAGLMAALLLLLLAVISNDLSLRSLGTRRWRSIQRWAYAILVLTILHGALYQVLEKQRLVLVGCFLLLAGGIVVGQLLGRARHLARQRARELRSAG